MSAVDAPLSFAQQRMWFLDRLAPGNPAYNILSGRVIRGSVGTETIAAALRTIVSRHEPLRTVYRDTDGEPRQYVLPAPEIRIDVEDCTELDPSRRADRLAEVAEEIGRQRFDLTKDAPLRAHLARCGPTEHVLHVAVHHIAIDGWSLGVLYRELLRLCAGDDVPALTTSYSEIAAAERAAEPAGEAADLDHWQDALADLPPLLDLPADRPRPATPS